MKALIIITLTTMLLMHATAYPVQAERGSGRGNMAGRSKSLYDKDLTTIPKLDLTAEQTASIRSLHEKHAMEIEPLRTQFFNKRNELKAAWLQAQPDREKLQLLRDEMHVLNKKLHEKIARYRAEVLDVLTLEQRDQLETAANSEQGLHREQKRRWWKAFGN